MMGWLLGVDPVPGRPRVKLWVRTGAGVRCILKEFKPVWYARARDGDYRDLRLKLGEMEDCSFEMTEMHLFADGDRPRRIMKVTMDTCSPPAPRVNALEAFLGIERCDFYNVDIDAARQYMVANNLFPLCRVEVAGDRVESRDNPYSLHYPVPDLRTVWLSVVAHSDGPFPSLSDPIHHVVLEHRPLMRRCGDDPGMTEGNWKEGNEVGSKETDGSETDDTGMRRHRGAGRGGSGQAQDDRGRSTGEQGRRSGGLDGSGQGQGDGGRSTGMGRRGGGEPGADPGAGERSGQGAGSSTGVHGCKVAGSGAGVPGGKGEDVRAGMPGSRGADFGAGMRGGERQGGGGDHDPRKRVITGDERHILSRLRWEIRNVDLILTRGGDSFDLPYLHARAAKQGMDFTLGREGHRIGGKRGSYFSYGRVLHRPDFWLLKGRFHLDTANAFLYAEGGLEGCIDLSRMSCIAFQTLARVSPGTVINAMEVHWALRNGYPIPFRKNIPESPKTLNQLLRADRGGYIFNPVAGLHEEVVEMDFFSMFPMIMEKYNISPETLNCRCCSPDERIPVPGLTYHFCGKRTGMIPQVIGPILRRRMQLRKLTRHSGDGFARRSTALKWLLVTSFGYTGYRNARFGQIECHESINAVDRELMVRSAELAQRHGFEVLHGIVDSLWLKGPVSMERGLPGCAETLRARIEGDVGIPLKLEGIFHWIVFLPNRTTNVGALNRYYGKYTTGELKVRGIELRMHDTPEYFRRLQTAMLEVLRRAENREEFLRLVPDAVQVLGGFARELLRGEADPRDLVFHRRTSRDLGEYAVLNEQVAALLQLEEHGVTRNAGQGVDYVILDRTSRDPAGKVRVRELMHGDEEYDRKVYYRYLLRCGESLLMPVGYDRGALDRAVTAGGWGF